MSPQIKDSTIGRVESGSARISCHYYNAQKALDQSCFELNSVFSMILIFVVFILISKEMA